MQLCNSFSDNMMDLPCDESLIRTDKLTDSLKKIDNQYTYIKYDLICSATLDQSADNYFTDIRDGC